MVDRVAGAGSVGFVLVDKPPGLTSHDVVGRLRRILGTRKVGHAGTLDPMATGLLVCGVGQATRLLTYVTGAAKTYEATIRLGSTTDTEDAMGNQTSAIELEGRLAEISAALPEAVGALTGPISQRPSSVSAIKVDGKRAYARVRAGEEVALASRDVVIESFEVENVRECITSIGGGTVTNVELDAVVSCSSGTYIRALARDLGESLGLGGHLSALRRTRVGPFTLADSRTLEEIGEEAILMSPTEVCGQLFQVYSVPPEDERKVCNGVPIAAGDAADAEGQLVAVASGEGRALAVVRVVDGRLKSTLVFNQSPTG